MKKIVICVSAVIAACAAYAMNTANAKATVIVPPQSVSAGATVTNAALAVRSYKGIGEVACLANAVAAASSNRIVTVQLYGTNTVSGGWKLIEAASKKGAEACILRVPFHGEALPPYVRTVVSVTVANTIVSGVMMGY